MANYSLSEIDALAKKATRGAGYSWGIAEEVGKSVRWLSAYGFLGAETLANHLEIVADKSHSFKPQLQDAAAGEKLFKNKDQPLCALYCSALINDLGHHLQDHQTLIFNNMLSPLLALSAVGRIAEIYDMAVSFTITDKKIVCNSNGISIKDTPPLLSGFLSLSSGKLKQLSCDARLGTIPEGSMQNVSCNQEEKEYANTHFPSPQSRPIADDALIVLEKFAHKTYAPATEESRLRGAG